jgi:hypothetical protein
LRLLLSIAAAQGFEILQLDVKTEFLHGELMEEIYVRHPPGYGDGTGRVWRLKKVFIWVKTSSACLACKIEGSIQLCGFISVAFGHLRIQWGHRWFATFMLLLMWMMFCLLVLH